MTKSELEELVLKLEDQVDQLVEIVDGWLPNPVDVDESFFECEPDRMALIADHLSQAFVWEDSPLQPKDFDDWDELYSWFESLGEE